MKKPMFTQIRPPVLSVNSSFHLRRQGSCGLVRTSLPCLLTAALFLLVLLTTDAQGRVAETRNSPATPAGLIAAGIKPYLSRLTASEVTARVAGHFHRLRLLGADGRWAAPELAAIAERLVPDDLGPRELGIFLDLMAEYASRNQYLTDFLTQAVADSNPEFARQIAREGPQVFPEVITYALALDRLTRAMCDDWRILAACERVWRHERRTKVQLVKHWGGWAACFFIKLASVEAGIERVLDYHRSGKVPGTFMRTILPMNILEATSADLARGCFGNVHAGRVLAQYRPGASHQDKKTGEGPTVWSPDHRIMLFQMALPRLWADLYATWNLAFVSQMPDSPFLMAKLLIPIVNDYDDQPAGYIYHRGVALYAHLHYAGFRSWDLAATGQRLLQWQNRRLTIRWGRVNSEAAGHYKKAVKE
jgi:hypothetical protein